MQLTVWTYEGPPHVGAMRIATAMDGVHYVLHAPQGDTYADLLFTMIERRGEAPARHLHHVPGARPRRRHRGAVQDRRARSLRALQAAGDAGRRFVHRRADPGRSGRARTCAWTCRYRWCRSSCPPISARRTGARPRPSTSWCVRSRDHRAAARREASRARRWRAAALQSARTDRAGLPPSRRCARSDRAAGSARRRRACRRATRGDARRSRSPRRGGLQRRALSGDRGAGRAVAALALSASPPRRPSRSASARTREFIEEVAALAGVDPAPALAGAPSRLPWYSRSVDSTYLTGKRVFIFGDATHAVAAARVASRRAGLHGRRARHLQPRVRARGARGGEAVRRRAADHRRLSRSRGEGRRSCSRSWCSARRWSATSPSGSAFRAP